jgi:hypothetical protein
MWIGFFLICAGILVILGNMGILRGDVWDYAWPLFFIFLGASMIIRRMRKDSDKSGPHGDFQHKI